MKKAIFWSFCFVWLFSCKKEEAATQVPESANQLLTKVIKTTTLSADRYYNETVNYEYNSAGKLVIEGNKRYTRDPEQRIIQIFDPGTGSNRENLRVFYYGAQSSKVAYTLCVLKGGGATDSVVYIHDAAERLIRTISYFTYLEDSHTPAIPFLSYVEELSYDETGNIKTIDSYNGTGTALSHCAQYIFKNYDKKTNPQFAEDEVRSIGFLYQGVLNNSLNNCTSISGYTKNYEYRADGRPRSCVVKYNGVYSYTLDFKYD